MVCTLECSGYFLICLLEGPSWPSRWPALRTEGWLAFVMCSLNHCGRSSLSCVRSSFSPRLSVYMCRNLHSTERSIRVRSLLYGYALTTASSMRARSLLRAACVYCSTLTTASSMCVRSLLRAACVYAHYCEQHVCTLTTASSMRVRLYSH